MARSNDKDIPADEMLLAEAIAAAKARGLGWCEGALYVRECGDYANSPDEASACCALGAIYLARPDRKADRILDCSIAFGNDYDAEWRGDVMLDDDFVSVEVDPNGESLGWAFRCAMTDGGES